MNTREMRLNDSSLYHSDFLIWLNTQVELLQTGQFDQLDLGHLVEEITDMGRALKLELLHRMDVLLTHMLKCQYQSGRMSKSWRRTMAEQRRRISRLLLTAPSLRPLLEQEVADAYAYAVRHTCSETGLPASTFPGSCPWTTEQILDPDFLPGS
jgi:hypothetical protein